MTKKDKFVRCRACGAMTVETFTALVGKERICLFCKRERERIAGRKRKNANE